MTGAAVMLFDDAVYALAESLESVSHGTLSLSVDHGQYHGRFSVGGASVHGETRPTLTDALVSLVEALRARQVAPDTGRGA